MFIESELIIAFFVALFSTLLLVYPIKKLSIKIGAVDLPNYRKVHKDPMPRLGGLAIFLGVAVGLIYLRPVHEQLFEIYLGAVVIVITGILDDKYQIKPLLKLGGQFLAAGILINGGLIIERVTLPVFGMIDLGNFSIIITLLWVVGISNAINLIDGLDGLASGVSAIALTSILVMALIDTRSIVIALCVILIGSNLGFLFHNFNPAKIYMGDTGSMFLGYMIAVISILGLFKNVTLFSFVIPIIVLALPIFDTLFSMTRRALNGEKIMMPDKKHIHHQFLDAGFNHRNTVLVLYGVSGVFGILAILFSTASPTLSLIVCIIFIFLLQLFAEFVGLVGKGKRPLLKMGKNMIKKLNHRR